jgi:hypothetical protein
MHKALSQKCTAKVIEPLDSILKGVINEEQKLTKNGQLHVYVVLDEGLLYRAQKAIEEPAPPSFEN